LDFEPSSGQLASVRAPAGESRGACVEAAVQASIRWGRPFEPRTEGDETLVCRFENGDYDCRRLGPEGAYLPIEPAADG
ncbi:MAG: hypothetical protein AAF721_15720, partial [Myxococcota bacterium]